MRAPFCLCPLSPTRGRYWTLRNRDWGTGDSLSLGGMQYIPNKTISPAHFRNSESTFPSLIQSVWLERKNCFRTWVRRTTFDRPPGVMAKMMAENILSFQLVDVWNSSIRASSLGLKDWIHYQQHYFPILSPSLEWWHFKLFPLVKSKVWIGLGERRIHSVVEQFGGWGLQRKPSDWGNWGRLGEGSFRSDKLSLSGELSYCPLQLPLFLYWQQIMSA